MMALMTEECVGELERFDLQREALRVCLSKLPDKQKWLMPEGGGGEGDVTDLRKRLREMGATSPAKRRRSLRQHATITRECPFCSRKVKSGMASTFFRFSGLRSSRDGVCAFFRA